MINERSELLDLVLSLSLDLDLALRSSLDFDLTLCSFRDLDLALSLSLDLGRDLETDRVLDFVELLLVFVVSLESSKSDKRRPDRLDRDIFDSERALSREHDEVRGLYDAGDPLPSDCVLDLFERRCSC